MPSEDLIQRYAQAGIQLLPPGEAFALATDDDSALHDVIEGIAVELARIHEEAEALFRNTATPAQASEYLDDWEEVLGLPGQCVTNPPTSDVERAGAVVAALRGRTSHAKAVYEAAAAAMGYDALEFRKYTPMSVGMPVGNPVYGDEWAHCVSIYVPVGDQTADEQLICTFVDQLRRSHCFLDIHLEGPMGAARTNTVNYYNATSLGASGVLANLPAISVSYGGHVSIQCTIAQSNRTSAPSDTPVGVWELYCSSDGVNFTQLTATAVTTELAKIAPNGNNVVNAYAIFEGVPGTSIKLRYNRTSGGGTNACTFTNVTTW